jgi:all-trans-retinol 13,14-reductase
MRSTHEYDAIVIGSGIGGLTVASLLAQIAKQRVLVLERHFKPGGFTQTFHRHGYTWDTGLHYVGEMAPGAMTRVLFDFISASNVKWHKMPATHERFIYPNLNFGMPANREQFQEDLLTLFPAEEEAICGYFHDLKRAHGWFIRSMMGKLFPSPVAKVLTFPHRSLALQSTQRYFDKQFRDPQLKALLLSQWGDYGLPPSLSAFAIHALIVTHYLDGAYYPEGGSGVIAEHVLPAIEAAGGACYVNHEVTEVIVQEGRAVGVRVNCSQGGKHVEKEFYAPTIISNAGAYTTFRRLLPTSLKLPEQEAVHSAAGSASVVTLYLGLAESPARLDFQGENHWIYPDYDHEATFQNRNRLLDGQAASCFLSFPSLKNPSARRHTAEIIAWVDYSSFAQWQDRPWRRRGEEYEALKQRISDALLDLVERHYPGFRQIVAFQELSTPLSVESFTGHRQGAIYGIPATPERFRNGWFNIRSTIPGLLLTGSDVASAGIVGAMMGGVLTAADLLGPLGYFKIMSAARRHSRNAAGPVPSGYGEEGAINVG